MVYDISKIRASLGSTIKVKVGGKYRMGRLIGTGIDKNTLLPMVKVTIDYTEMPWSSPFPQTSWYPMEYVRKSDKAGWVKD